MAIVDSLGEAERQAAKELEAKLSAHAAASESAFNAVGQALTAVPELPISEVTLARRVVTVLMVRLSNDLRGVALMALRGYSLQAAALAASVYEVSYCVGYIGSDESRADAWLKHDDPTKPFRNIRSLTEEIGKDLGISNPAQVSESQYRVYRQLCLAKHSNPLLQKDHGHYADDEAVFAVNGPDVSEGAVRVARFALEHATRLAVLAIASFLDNHVPSDRKIQLVESIHHIDQAVKNLAQSSIREYGNEDPYPGDW